MSNFSPYIAMWAGRAATAFAALLVLGLVVVSCAMNPVVAAGTKGSIQPTVSEHDVKYEDLGGAPLRMIYACADKSQFMAVMRKLTSGRGNGAGHFFETGKCKTLGGKAADPDKVLEQGTLMFTAQDHDRNPVVAVMFPKTSGHVIYMAFWISLDLLRDPA